MLHRLLCAGGKAVDCNDIQVIAFAIIDSGHPIGANEALILRILQNLGIQCSETELRRELCYLEDKGVIRLDRVDGALWLVRLVGPATGITLGDAKIAVRPVAEAAQDEDVSPSHGRLRGTIRPGSGAREIGQRPLSAKPAKKPRRQVRSRRSGRVAA